MRHSILFILVAAALLPASPFALAVDSAEREFTSEQWLAANSSLPNPVTYNGGTMAPRASIPASTSTTEGVTDPTAGPSRQIELEVTLDYNLLNIKLYADALQLAGINHLPKSEVEQQTLSTQLDKLQHADQVFLAPQSAECSLNEFNMKTLQKAITEGGMTLEAKYQLSCNTPRALRRLEITLFQSFENITSAKVKLDNQQLKKTTHIDGENRFLLLK